MLGAGMGSLGSLFDPPARIGCHPFVPFKETLNGLLPLASLLPDRP